MKRTGEVIGTFLVGMFKKKQPVTFRVKTEKELTQECKDAAEEQMAYQIIANNPNLFSRELVRFATERAFEDFEPKKNIKDAQ